MFVAAFDKHEKRPTQENWYQPETMEINEETMESKEKMKNDPKFTGPSPVIVGAEKA